MKNGAEQLENEKLSNENQSLRQEVKLLHQKVDFLMHRLFGRKSEILDPDQLAFNFLNTLTAPEEPDDDPPPSSPKSKKKKKRKPFKERLPDHLPIEEVVLDPEEVKADPESYSCIGQEVSDELDVTPTRYFIRRTIRRKFKAKADRTQPPLLHPAPARLIDNSSASAGLLTSIVLSKYEDHLPLYRQEQILHKRYGIDLSRKTMASWMENCAEWLSPLYRSIQERIRQAAYVQIDETPIRYQQQGGCKQGYLWVYHVPNQEVYYQWHTSRKASCLEAMMKGYQGVVHSDGYQAYQALAKRHKTIEHACCLTHMRRKFYEAREENPCWTNWVLRQLGHLYHLEGQLRNQRAGPNLRYAYRQSVSQPIMHRIKQALEEKQKHVLPRSGLGKAILYGLGLWKQLSYYLDNGRVEIDTNQVENAIRPTALGKKNWLFIGSPEAGKRAAIFYTLLETCKRYGINTQDYLHDVLTRLPTMKNHEVDQLAPVNWARKSKHEIVTAA